MKKNLMFFEFITTISPSFFGGEIGGKIDKPMTAIITERPPYRKEKVEIALFYYFIHEKAPLHGNTRGKQDFQREGKDGRTR